MMPLRVAHSCYKWLSLTQGWLYRQVAHLPSALVTAHIICERTENLDQFAWPCIHAPHPYALRYQIERVWRKLGWQHHLTHTAQTIQKQNIQLLHSHFGDKGWRDLGAMRHTTAKHIVTFYGYDVNRLPEQEPIWHSRYAELFANTHQVLCEGSFMRQSVINLGANPDQVRVQHLGVDVDQIVSQPRQPQPSEPFKVLLAASFTEKKGIPDGLEALGRLLREHNIPLQITLIGDARPDPRQQAEKATILATLDQWGLRPFTRLLGYQPYATLFAEAYQHHVFLSPSHMASDGDTEGGAPVSLIDMQATGMPVVSTTHCDIPEVVQHGRTGLLAVERDIDGLVQHLLWLAQNPQQWAIMGAAGRAHIEQEYNARTQGERLARIYEEVCT